MDTAEGLFFSTEYVREKDFLYFPLQWFTASHCISVFYPDNQPVLSLHTPGKYCIWNTNNIDLAT